MTGMEQPAQTLLPTTEKGGYVSITNIIRSDTANRTDLTIQPKIIHMSKTTGMGNSDRNPFSVVILNSGRMTP